LYIAIKKKKGISRASVLAENGKEDIDIYLYRYDRDRYN